MALLASWPLAFVWLISLVGASLAERAGGRVIAISIALASLISGIASTKYSLHPFPRETASRDALWTGSYVALGSIVPGLAFLSGCAVPYLVGVTLHAGRHKGVWIRSLLTSVASIAAVISVGYWTIALENM